ncbi:hypothetical protein FACS1894145_5120 [Bacteroidia bacterium]|nr:hypothetical protein FACS1894145_5120 [Bacteroidia bacterium]
MGGSKPEERIASNAETAIFYLKNIRIFVPIKQMNMKRFTLILLSLSALFVLSFTSCEENDNYLNTQTIFYTVNFEDWEVGSDDKSGDYLYCTFKEPLITDPIYYNGLIIPYKVFDEKRLTPLPSSDFWIDDVYGKVEEQLTCEIEPGYVTFILKSDDHYWDPYFYEVYKFALKLAW